jgi:hypothetical protein
MRVTTLLLLLVAPATGFKFMADWKLPTAGDFAKHEAIKERFGDKSKLIVDC